MFESFSTQSISLSESKVCGYYKNQQQKYLLPAYSAYMYTKNQSICNIRAQVITLQESTYPSVYDGHNFSGEQMKAVYSGCTCMSFVACHAGKGHACYLGCVSLGYGTCKL